MIFEDGKDTFVIKEFLEATIPEAEVIEVYTDHRGRSIEILIRQFSNKVELKGIMLI